MNWFSKLISGGVSTVVDSVGNAIDKVVTSDEEREQIKLEIKKASNDLEKSLLEGSLKLEQELSKRHASDMLSDSWLSKNVRPLMVIFLTLSTVVLAYLSIFVLKPESVGLVKPWVSILSTLTVTAYGFYFGSKGVEKVTKIKNIK